jgi:hypothetical protein
LSPGRRTNRENFRSYQRTRLFLLLLFLESIKKASFYLFKNQSSAARPQPGAAYFVQSANQTGGFTSSDRRFSAIFPEGVGAPAKAARIYSAVKIPARTLLEADSTEFETFLLASCFQKRGG